MDSQGISGAPPRSPSLCGGSDVDSPVARRPSRKSLAEEAPLHNLVVSANAMFLAAKESLESKAAGNLKREVRERVVTSMNAMLDTILRLAESQRTVVGRLERTTFELALANKQIENLEGQTARSDVSILEEIKKEVRATRLLVEQTSRAASRATVTPAEIGNLKTLIEHNAGVTRRSYAAAAACRPTPQYERATISPPRGPTHTVVVTSSNKSDSSEDVLRKVRAVVDARGGGIEIERVRKARDQKLVVSCRKEQHIGAIREKVSKSNSGLIIETTANRDPLVVIMGVLSHNTDRQILDSIWSQNGRIAEGLAEGDRRAVVKYRRRAKNPAEGNVVLQVSPALWRRMLEVKWVHIDFQRRPVFDESPLVQCTRCLGYGHSRRFCREAEDKCGHCAGAHIKRNCPALKAGAPPKCRNCLGAGRGDIGHHAFSNVCPQRTKWDRLARSKTNYS